MNIRVFDQIRESLSVRRNNLAEWLFNTPVSKRQIQLGAADESDVQEHMETLNSAIQEAEAGALGVCEVCHDHVDSHLLEMDYTACVCLEHLSEDDRRTLEFELEMAMTVQRSLLPHEPPDFPQLRIAAFSRPAQILGGDYFDFLRFADGSYGLVIADVAGHGISASLHMASMQTLLRAFTPASATPAEVISQLHRLLIHNVQFTTFVTIFLAAYDPQRHVLTYTNAGHNPPILLRAGASPSGSSEGLVIEWLRPTAAAVGLVEDAEFQLNEITLLPGDLLLMYTDGISEALDEQNQEFGAERLAQALREASARPVQEIPAFLRSKVERFTGGTVTTDDVTLVVCRVID